MQKCVHTCVYTCVHTCVYTCVYACVHTCVYTCVYAYVHTCVCVYTFAHACISVATILAIHDILRYFYRQYDTLKHTLCWYLSLVGYPEKAAMLVGAFGIEGL